MSTIKYTYGTNEGGIKVIVMLWSIPNYVSLLNTKNIQEYRTENCKDISTIQVNPKFQMKMIFLGKNNDLIEIYYISPKVLLLKTVCPDEDGYNHSNDVYEESDYHMSQADEWQYLTTLYKRDLSSSNQYNNQQRRRTYQLRNGTLIFRCEYQIKNELKTYVSVPEKVPKFHLSNDLESLLDNGMFSDLVMKSEDGTEYKAHKAILASRSAVLKANFEHNTKECLTSTIETHLDANTLKEVLTFIYCDEAPRVDEFPDKLLAAADYYQLNRLKGICEKALHKKLTVDNAIEILQFADAYSAPNLKQSTLRFIKDGRTRLITKTEGWSKLESAEIFRTLYEYTHAE